MTATERLVFPLPFLPHPLQALPAAINHVLDQEPWAREQLHPHAGKTVLLSVPPFEFRATITDDGRVRLADREAAPNVSLRLPAGAFATMAARGPRAALREVSLDGDAEFAQVLSLLAQNLRWEFEEDLSHAIGDMAAHRVTRAMRFAAGGLRDAATRLGENVVEYFLEEDRQLVRSQEVEALADLVRDLRDDVARLEKRIDRLGRS
ncbi:MAG: SCP2 sterol-binding domain-containing protein [Burkholderiaceae bacterium]|jgi:ubiquinone biosynthesis protein UbiJ